MPSSAGEIQVGLAIVHCDLLADVSTNGAPAARWLHHEERARLDRFQVDHARRDFIAGRVASKIALSTITDGSTPESWWIASGLWNQPCVRGPQAGLGVTLTHTSGYGIAAAFDNRWICGIDLESGQLDLAETVATIASAEERTWAESTGDPTERAHRWLRVWTAREALGKALKTGLLFPELLPASTRWRALAENRWASDFTNNSLLSARIAESAGLTAAMVTPNQPNNTAAVDVMMEWIEAHLAV